MVRFARLKKFMDLIVGNGMRLLAYIFSLFFLFTDSYAATQPKFLIVPTTDVNIILNKTSEAIVQYRVTNQTDLTRQLTMVSIAGIEQIVDGANYCANPFTLAHGQSCLLTLKARGSDLNIGTTNKAIEVCKTQTNQNVPDPFLCSRTTESNNLKITVKAPPRLSATPRVLRLTAGGSSASLNVTNLSTSEQAINIEAYLDNTTLSGEVALTYQNCELVEPGKTCSITFTPGSTDVSLTFFRIQGENTFPTPAAASISSTSTTAQISVSGSPLVLTAGGSSGTLVVHNDSSTITAVNVQAQLSPQVSASVTQNASDCASVAPGQTCNLIFTPTSTPLSTTTIDISGTNTSITSAQISVNSAAQAELIITSTLPLILKANGSTTGTITILNNSSSITATNISADFSGTPLTGAVTATTCASVAPKASCTMTFTPGTNTVVPTSFPIYGSNTTTVTGQVAISSYFIYITNTGNGDGVGGVIRCNVSMSDGELTGCATVMSNVLYRPSGITFNEAGTYAYIVKATPSAVMSCPVSSTGSISSSSCKTTTLNSAGSSSANGVVYNPQRDIVQVTVSTNTVYTCTLSSGSITSCALDSSVSNLSYPVGIALNPGLSIAYIANYSSSSIISCVVSSSNGSLSSCTTTTGLGSYLSGVAINPQNTFAYYTKQTSNAVAWASIGTSGALTYSSQLVISGVQNATGLALNGATNYIYIGNGSGNQVMKCTADPLAGTVSLCNFTGVTLLSFPYGVGLYPNPPYIDS